MVGVPNNKTYDIRSNRPRLTVLITVLATRLNNARDVLFVDLNVRDDCR